MLSLQRNLLKSSFCDAVGFDVEAKAACDICVEKYTEALTYEKAFFLLSSGDFSEDAGFAADTVCKAGPPAFHQRHPKYIHSHRPVWILGMV